jgi:hypothetical protein
LSSCSKRGRTGSPVPIRRCGRPATRIGCSSTPSRPG